MIKVRDNSGEKYRRSNHVVSFCSKEFFFSNVGHFLSLYWICYNIVAILCFLVLRILAPQSGIQLTPFALEDRVLTMGLSGKSPPASFMRPTGHWKVFWVSQKVKSLPAMQETWVWSLGQEDPPEKGTAIHSNILAWRIPWTEEPGRLQPVGS